MDETSWTRLYRLLAGLGMPQPDVPVRLVDTSTGEVLGVLPLGWPDIKVALGFDHSDTRPFEGDDWTVVRLTGPLARTLPETLAFLDELSFAHLVRGSEHNAAQTVSRTERRLLRALLDAGLPVPERNFRFCDPDTGRIVTVPDFVWHDVRLAVFLDGSFFHGGRDLDEALRQIAQAGEDSQPGRIDPTRRRALQERFASKAQHDARKRRMMTAAGWTVLVVSDRDVDDDGDLDGVVTSVRDTYLSRVTASAAGETG